MKMQVDICFKITKTTGYFKQPLTKKYLYYWGDLNKLCSQTSPIERCNIVKDILTKVTPINIDFDNITKTLTEQDKEKIFHLAGFDYSKIKNQFQNKDVFLYALGADWHNPNTNSQLAALKTLCTKKNEGLWFYKHHPNKRNLPTHQVLTHLCPNIQQLDTHIPFELLLINGLKPKGLLDFPPPYFST